jgi:hypothetical protein
LIGRHVDYEADCGDLFYKGRYSPDKIVSSDDLPSPEDWGFPPTDPAVAAPDRLDRRLHSRVGQREGVGMSATGAMRDGTPFWGGGPDRVYFDDPDAQAAGAVAAHLKGSFVRELVAYRVKEIARRLEEREAGYEATDAAEDLLEQAACLAAFSALRSEYGTAHELRMAVLQDAIRRQLGATMYRAVDLNGDGEVWPRRASE